jgi:hypothetical protein
VQTYFALIGEKKWEDAWKLWGRGGDDLANFTATMAAYRQYDAQVGAPGPIEGAAGSLYVEVPVQVYGRDAAGTEFHRLGKAVLRRVNDVPGSTPEQRRWHIEALDLVG